MNIAGLVRLAPRCCLFCSPELAAIGLRERRPSRAPRRHPRRPRGPYRARARSVLGPQSDLPHQPGALLRSEPLKDVILPAGIRGWRILMQPLWTTACQRRRSRPCSRQPILPQAHVLSSVGDATTGLLQKCMPSLLSMPSKGIPSATG